MPAFALAGGASESVLAAPNGFHNLIAQADDTAAAEPTRRRARRQAAGAGDSGGAPFGERPFRRPLRDAGEEQSNGDAAASAAGKVPAGAANAGPADGAPGGGPPAGGRFGGRLKGRFNRDQMPPGGGPEGFRGFRGKQQLQGGFFGKRPLDLSTLNLSDDQKQQIQQIRSGNSAKSRELHKSLASTRDALRSLMFDPNATEDQIRSKRRELRQMQDKAEEMQIGDFLSIRRVLTPEQRQKLSDLNSGDRMAASPRTASDAGAPQGDPPPAKGAANAPAD
ncbi:MAG: Spy/CpxP family protein refolding chaperone [Terriglobales bacterium]